MKKGKTNLTPIIVIVLIIGLVAYFGYYSTTLKSIGGGFSTLSLSKVAIQSNNSDVNGDAWLMTAVVDGGGEKATGHFTPEQVQQLTGKQTTTGNFDISVEMVKNDCSWNIQEQPNWIVESGGCGWWQNNYLRTGTDCVPSSGENGCPTKAFCQQTGSGYDFYCASHTPQYVGGRLDSTLYFDWQMKVTVTKSNGDQVVTYLSPSDTSASLGNQGRVKLIGGLIGNQFCPAPYTDTALIRPVGTNTNWKAIDFYKLQTYLSAKNQFLSIFSMPGLNNVGTCQITGNAFASAYTQVINSNPPIDYSCSFKTSSNGTKYSCTPSSQIYLPTIQLIIKADWLGLNIPSGRPQITQTNVISGYARNTWTYPVLIKNVGSEADSFDVSLSCSPEQLSSNAQRIYLIPNEEETVNFNINGIQIGAHVCTVRAYSVNTPQNTVSSNTTLTLIKPLCALQCCEEMADYQNKHCPATSVNTYTNESGSIYETVSYQCVNNNCIKNAINVSEYPTFTTTTEEIIIEPPGYMLPPTTTIGGGIQQPQGFNLGVFINGIIQWFKNLFGG